MTKAGKDRWVN